MLRIHFGPDDLGRVRIAAGPWHELELTHSLQVLRDRSATRLEGWRQEVRGRLGDGVRNLFELVPADGSPDELIDPDAPDATAYQVVAMAPFLRWVRTLVDADRALRGRTLVDEGVERVLRTLHPMASWDSPVLAVGPAAESEVRLAGRGLVLQPSVFCWRAPVYRERGGQPTLACPVQPEWAGRCDPGELGALIGRTRAVMLELLATSGSTTTELSRGCGLSLAAASQHTSVLRSAGLITTQWVRGARFHALTPVGAALLADPTAEPGEPGWAVIRRSAGRTRR